MEASALKCIYRRMKLFCQYLQLTTTVTSVGHRRVPSFMDFPVTLLANSRTFCGKVTLISFQILKLFFKSLKFKFYAYNSTIDVYEFDYKYDFEFVMLTMRSSAILLVNKSQKGGKATIFVLTQRASELLSRVWPYQNVVLVPTVKSKGRKLPSDCSAAGSTQHPNSECSPPSGLASVVNSRSSR